MDNSDSPSGNSGLSDAVLRELTFRATKKKPPLWERHPTLTGGLIALLAAVLSGFIGYGGATVGANASFEAANIQRQAEDVRRSQDRRDVVYKEFLEASNKYFYVWEAAADSSTPKRDAAEARAADALRAARFEYQGQLNEVYVHGSNTAWEAAKRVNATLPSSPIASPVLSSVSVPNPAAFRTAFNDLLDIRCREAAPVARSGCVGG